MVLDSWLEKRRRQELERVNRELHELKSKGLNYNPAYLPGGKPPSRSYTSSSYDSPVYGENTFFDAKTVMILVLGLFILATVFFIQLSAIHKEKTLTGQYSAELEKVTQDLESATSLLEEQQLILEQKAQEGENLGSQFQSMNDLNKALQTDLDALEEKKDELSSEIQDLEEELIYKKSEVNFYKSCITDEDTCDMSLVECGEFEP